MAIVINWLRFRETQHKQELEKHFKTKPDQWPCVCQLPHVPTQSPCPVCEHPIQFTINKTATAVNILAYLFYQLLSWITMCFLYMIGFLVLSWTTYFGKPSNLRGKMNVWAWMFFHIVYGFMWGIFMQCLVRDWNVSYLILLVLEMTICYFITHISSTKGKLYLLMTALPFGFLYEQNVYAIGEQMDNFVQKFENQWSLGNHMRKRLILKQPKFDIVTQSKLQKELDRFLLTPLSRIVLLYLGYIVL